MQEALKGCVTGYHGTGSMVGALKRLNDTGAHAAPDHIVLDDMPADRFLNQINLRMSEFSVKLADAVYGLWSFRLIVVGCLRVIPKPYNLTLNRLQ